MTPSTPSKRKREPLVDGEQHASPTRVQRVRKPSEKAAQALQPIHDETTSTTGTLKRRKTQARRGAEDASADISQTTAAFATPTKVHKQHKQADTTAADRSARRKSSNKLLEAADDSGAEEERELAQRILQDDDTDDGEPEDMAVEEPEATAETPSKTRRKRKPKEEPPPQDLPPYEMYFFQNKGGLKTSHNTFSSRLLPSQQDYISTLQQYRDHHIEDIRFLQALHERSFHQWAFELEQGFSVCLHGWGSKGRLLSRFANYCHDAYNISPTIIMVNGFDLQLTIREIFGVVASAMPALEGQKLGAQPADVLSTILNSLDENPPPMPLYLFIRSMDGQALRKVTLQSLLGRLVSSKHVRLVASCDTMNFGLLWDSSLQMQFNFVFHDATTFQSFDAEIAHSSVDGAGAMREVMDLLGRSSRRVQGKDGVVFVLRSLTESARRLFSMLIAEVLMLDQPSIVNGDGENEQRHQPKKKGPVFGVPGGVETRALYRKAVEDLIASNEIVFTTLLKEFYDHEMVLSKRDSAGVEFLVLPFRTDELEAIAEDLVILEP